MNKKDKNNYRNKSEILLKKLFKNKFKSFAEVEKLKQGDIYIFCYKNSCELQIIINAGYGVSIIKSFETYRELYLYTAGLYDMKTKKIQDYIKATVNNK